MALDSVPRSARHRDIEPPDLRAAMAGVDVEMHHEVLRKPWCIESGVIASEWRRALDKEIGPHL